MKLWGVSMVRNESDIVEAFVRHNLSILDGLVVVDHGSADTTPGILDALCAERLPLVVLRNDVPGYLQAEITTTAVRETFARFAADFVFPLDADEFLHVNDRATLERFLGALPAGSHGRLAWHTYVPQFFAPESDFVTLARRARRLAAEEQGYAKVVVARSFAETPGAYVAMGNHRLFVGDRPPAVLDLPLVDLPPAVASIAHLPVRSAAQIVAKIAVKRLVRIAAARDYGPEAPNRRAYESLRESRPLTMETALAVFVSGYTPRSGSHPATIDDPFLADITLRYTPDAAADPLPIVLAAVERLVRRVAGANTTAGTMPMSA